MKKPDIPDLLLTVDLGGSLTKIAAATASGKYLLLAVASEVAAIPRETLEEVQNGYWGEGNLESRLWVATKGGESYAVGRFARQRFKSQIDLSLPKTELAVPKILSALWILKEHFNLSNNFYIRLAVLLPAGECSTIDRQELVDLLKPSLTAFSTPTGKMSVKLFANPVVKPEGGGLLLHYKSLQGEEFSAKSVGILGIGFRNANLLICKDGTIAESDRITSDLGFYSLIQRCKEIVGSTVDEVELATVVAKVGQDINSRIISKYLQKINKEQRKDSFIDAIARSQTMYWTLLINWFKHVHIDSLDELVLYGGTSEYFREKLQNHFQDRVERLSWHAEAIVPPELFNNKIFEKEQLGLEFRFIDCWCLFQFVLERQTGYQPYSETNLVLMEA